MREPGRSSSCPLRIAAGGPSPLPRSLLRALGAAVVVLAAVVGWSAPALAHHPEVSGKVACPAGEQVVTWTVSNITDGRVRWMVIKKIEITRGTVTGFKVGDKLEPEGRPGDTVTGTTTLPGDATGSVTLSVTGGWVDEAGNPDGPQAETRSATVELPGDCTSPPVPKATVGADCDEGGARVALKNEGGEPVTFVVTKDGTTVDTIEVGPRDTETRNYPMTEDETATFRVTAPGYDSGPVPVTFDCMPSPAQPSATIAPSCVEGGALVTLTNTGGSDTTFSVLKGGAAVDSVEVGAGKSVTRTYPMTEDETATFQATAPGYDTGAVSVTYDCVPAPAQPAATIAVACAEGGAVTTLTNTGGTPATFTVLKGGAQVDSVDVAPGASVTRTYPMTEDETATFQATAPGYDTGAVSVTYDCVPAPAPPTPAAPTTQTNQTSPTAPPTQVLGNLVERPTQPGAPPADVLGTQAVRGAQQEAQGGQLPRTGGTALPLTGLALALIAFGWLLTKSGRPSPATVRAGRPAGGRT